MTRTLFDAVNVGAIPADARMVAGYVDGNWPTWASIVRGWPSATKVSIAVQTRHSAHVFDTEPGNPGPAAAADWVVKERRNGNGRAGIYTMRSWWGACIAELRARGIVPESVPFWIAEWTCRPHLIPGTVATQWCGPTACGGSVDVSTVADFWPGVDGGGAPVPPPRPQPKGKRVVFHIVDIDVWVTDGGTVISPLKVWRAAELGTPFIIVDVLHVEYDRGRAGQDPASEAQVL